MVGEALAPRLPVERPVAQEAGRRPRDDTVVVRLHILRRSGDVPNPYLVDIALEETVADPAPAPAESESIFDAETVVAVTVSN